MNKKRIIMVISVLMLILILLVLILVNVEKKSKLNPTVLSIETDEETKKEIQEAVDQALVKKLSGLSEQKRIEYYATEFIKALEGRKISTAYKLLNEDFKTNSGAPIIKVSPSNTAPLYLRSDEKGIISEAATLESTPK